MSWKIQTNPETPYIFVPGGSGTGGNMVPFDLEGLTPGDWFLSGVADLGLGVRTNKFWWQACSAFSNPPPPGQYLLFYAATADDSDPTNIDGLQPSGVTGNQFISGNATMIGGIPFSLTATVTDTGCSCLDGTFSLSYSSSQQVWTSGPITCPGAAFAAYAQFDGTDFGFAVSGTTIGHGDSAISDGTVVCTQPFRAEGNGWSAGNVNEWCPSFSSVNWTVRANLPPPDPANLNYIGALVSDGTTKAITSGYVEIYSRYLYVLAQNATNQALSPSGDSHQFYLLPVPDEVQ